ncbi:hypothetical protein [Brevundimonas sp.]|uniref:hypothetical protein n=1 Tax=Brevundimonas sp. TaxID=1871086 RepID=UPI001843A9AC|nr:hypothetical protein [Brevundimonas sp.]MBA4806023.1 hypothetical protein [Brevundimonas sp.]
MRQSSDPSPKGEKSGWRAFALGMAAMFAVMALWVVLVETGSDPDDEVRLIGRPQTEGEAEPERPISGYR